MTADRPVSRRIRPEGANLLFRSTDRRDGRFVQPAQRRGGRFKERREAAAVPVTLRLQPDRKTDRLVRLHREAGERPLRWRDRIASRPTPRTASYDRRHIDLAVPVDRVGRRRPGSDHDSSAALRVGKRVHPLERAVRREHHRSVVGIDAPSCGERRRPQHPNRRGDEKREQNQPRSPPASRGGRLPAGCVAVFGHPLTMPHAAAHFNRSSCAVLPPTSS